MLQYLKGIMHADGLSNIWAFLGFRKANKGIQLVVGQVWMY